MSEGKSVNVSASFEEEGVKKIGPLKLRKTLKAQVGQIKNAKIFEDGNLLINKRGSCRK